MRRSVVVLFAASLLGCQDPTEIKLALSTDVPCEKLKGVAITVGGRNDIEGKEPTTTSTTCTGNGELGTLTVVPSGAKTDEIVIRVAGGVGRDPEACTPPYGRGCIIARRALRFVEKRPLTLKIALKNACNGVACAADQTCVDGTCTGYGVPDDASCGPDGCGDEVLPKSNGVVLAPSPLVCGDTGGLEPGAAWPMLGGCGTHIGRSGFVGPGDNHVRWTFTAGGPIASGIAISADGTIYFGAKDKKLYAVDPSGRLKWAAAIASDVFEVTVPAIAADGTVLVANDDKNLYAVSPRGDVVWTHGIGGKMWPSPAIGGDGTIFMGGGFGQSNAFALRKDGTELWHFTAGAEMWWSATLGFGGVVYFGSEDHQLYALDLGGTKRWQFDVKEGAQTGAVAPNGTIYFAGKPSVCAVDKDGKLIWANPTKGWASIPSLGADGTIYAATTEGWMYAMAPDGKYLWNRQVTKAFDEWNQAIVGADGTIYIGGTDGVLYAFLPSGDTKWTLPTGGSIRGPAAIASDGTLYVGSDDGKLYAVAKEK